MCVLLICTHSICPITVQFCYPTIVLEYFVLQCSVDIIMILPILKSFYSNECFKIVGIWIYKSKSLQYIFLQNRLWVRWESAWSLLVRFELTQKPKLLIRLEFHGLAKIRVAPGGTLWPKIKVNQIASYCAMLYPRCCSLWPCTFCGLHSCDFDSSAGQTRGSHSNLYWGTDTTMWSFVHFYVFELPKST